MVSNGLVHMNMMTDDYYFYDEEHFLLVGKRTGQIYHLGDTVTVTLVKADVEKRQIDFVLGEVDNLMRIQEMMKNSEGYVGVREKKPFGRSGISKQSKRKARDIASLLNEENNILDLLVLQSIKRDAKTIKRPRKK